MTFEEMMNRVLATIEERADDYGPADAMFDDIAFRWGMSPKDVAMRMTDLKIARLTMGRPSEDGFIDAIAYLLFAWRFHDQEAAKAE